LVDALDELSRREALRTFPAALVASMLVLALLVRSWRGMAVAAACSGATVLLISPMVVTGREPRCRGAAVVVGVAVETASTSAPAVARADPSRRDHEAA
jgi:hypothetical protein